MPVRFDSLTITPCLNLNGFDRFLNSILLIDRFESGDVHWQVKSDGKLDMGVKPSNEARLLFLTANPVLGYTDLGLWMHPAVLIYRQLMTGGSFSRWHADIPH